MRKVAKIQFQKDKNFLNNASLDLAFFIALLNITFFLHKNTLSGFTQNTMYNYKNVLCNALWKVTFYIKLQIFKRI